MTKKVVSFHDDPPSAADSAKYKEALNVAYDDAGFYLTSPWFNFDWMFRQKNSKGDYVCNWVSLLEKGIYSQIMKENF